MSEKLKAVIQYFVARRRREERMARSARCLAAIEAHRQLARHYTERLTRLQTIARLTGMAWSLDLIDYRDADPAAEATTRGRRSRGRDGRAAARGSRRCATS